MHISICLWITIKVWANSLRNHLFNNNMHTPLTWQMERQLGWCQILHLAHLSKKINSRVWTTDKRTRVGRSPSMMMISLSLWHKNTKITKFSKKRKDHWSQQCLKLVEIIQWNKFPSRILHLIRRLLLARMCTSLLNSFWKTAWMMWNQVCKTSTRKTCQSKTNWRKPTPATMSNCLR